MKVIVLMSTYNGEKYLVEQIKSIERQENIEVELFIRDDGSVDNTKEILNELGYTYENGTNIGYINSFMWLIKNAPDADYYALSDQDDVWDRDKLICAIEELQRKEIKNQPCMYTGNTRLVDSNLQFITNEEKNPIVSLGSVMTKNFATGCTIVFNKKLKQLISNVSWTYISSHDSLLARVCLAVGGVVIFDNKPHMSYRQHGKNTIGASTKGIYRIKKRINKIFNDHSHSRSRMAGELLDNCSSMMSKDRIDLLKEYRDYGKSLKNTIVILTDSRIKCGNKKDDILFKFAILARWV